MSWLSLARGLTCSAIWTAFFLVYATGWHA